MGHDFRTLKIVNYTPKKSAKINSILLFVFTKVNNLGRVKITSYTFSDSHGLRLTIRAEIKSLPNFINVVITASFGLMTFYLFIQIFSYIITSS